MNAFNSTISQSSQQSGFSLLEVLIAVVITSIGLLGLAAMQATGLRNNHSAYHRSQATVLAYDIADRMRSNMPFISNYQSSYTATPPDPITEETLVDGQWVTLTVQPVSEELEISGCTGTGGCSGAQMAQSDLAFWAANLASALPGGTGSITQTGEVFTISVNWDDNRDGLVDANDPGIQVSFQP